MLLMISQHWSAAKASKFIASLSFGHATDMLCKQITIADRLLWFC
jgi:hypothetical protein